jgi:hypothetical protein
MSKRKTGVLPETVQESKLSEQDTRRIIERNEQIHLAIAILVHGRAYATTRFPHYSGFLTKLRIAYNMADAESFLFFLQLYFEQARKHIPQVPIKRKTDRIVEEVKRLIELYGVKPVASCLLARMVG